MRREQAIYNLEIKKKNGLSIKPDIHHSKVPSSEHLNQLKCTLPGRHIVSLNFSSVKLIFTDGKTCVIFRSYGTFRYIFYIYIIIG